MYHLIRENKNVFSYMEPHTKLQVAPSGGFATLCCLTHFPYGCLRESGNLESHVAPDCSI